MKAGIQAKLQAMLWDLPENLTMETVSRILTNPVETFRDNDILFVKALNSLSWYELTRLVGKKDLLVLLTDSTIQKLFPVQRRNYYLNARRLLSKYTVPPAGSGA